MLTRMISSFVLPPGGPLLTALLAALVWRRRPLLARTLLLSALLALYLLSTPLVAAALAAVAQPYPALRDPPAADAVVLLAAGLARHAPEYGHASVNGLSLLRARYAARLARRTGLPLWVSGGVKNRWPGPPLSEAALLQRLLREELDVIEVHIEERSLNTAENARYSAPLLGDRRVLLVTHAVHMPRALRAFRAAGVRAIPAPTGFFPTRVEPLGGGAWLPSAAALTRSRYVLYEWLARLWYRFSVG